MRSRAPEQTPSRAEEVWSVLLPDGVQDRGALSPQQRRLLDSCSGGVPAASARLSASLSGTLSEQELLEAVLGTIAGHGALRIRELAPDGDRVDVAPEPTSDDVARPALAATRRAVARLWRLSPHEHRLELEPSAGAVDGLGLMRALQAIVDRYGTHAQVQRSASPVGTARYFHELTQSDAGTEGARYWDGATAERCSVPVLSRSLGLRVSTREERRRCEVPLESDAFRRLVRLCASRGESLEAHLLGGWRSVLHALAPTEGGCLGAYRPGLSSEMPGAVGLMGRYVPVSIDAGSRDTVAGWIEDSANELAQLDPWVDFFSGMGAGRELLRFRVGFHHVELDGSTTLGAARVDAVELVSDLERFELELQSVRVGDEVRMDLAFDPDAIDASLVQMIAATTADLLRRIPDLLQTSVREAVRSSTATRTSRLVGSRTAESTQDSVDSVEEYARRAPESIAVRDGDRSFTYSDLRNASVAVDALLSKHGIGIGDCVAVFMHRRAELLPALLGVVRRGAHFLPIDASQPVSRVAALLADAKPKVVLVDTETARVSEGHHDSRVSLDDRIWREGPGEVPERACRPGPGELAYLLYTSGSTGTPKGVGVPRRAMMNYIDWAAETYCAEGGTGSVVHSSISFDLTMTSLFAPLRAGRSVALLPSDDPEELAGFLRRGAELSFLKLTPSGLRLLLALASPTEIAGATTHLVVGGEQLTRTAVDALARVAPDLAVTNEYGPTETTVGSCAHTFRLAQPVMNPVPVGRPIPNTTIAVVDADGTPVSLGVTGEIAISGDGVALGYRNNPEESERRFRPNAEGSLQYHTGDLGYIDAGGLLHYEGRSDDQLKIHGFRVEPAEVESILSDLLGVESVAVVAAKPSGHGNGFLCAFIVPTSTASEDLHARLEAWAREQLPMHARPDRFVMVEGLPLAQSGKVDRRQLARLAIDVRDDRPRGVVEISGDDSAAALGRVWKEVLGEESSPVLTDSFFAMGGDSVKALHLVTGCHRLGFDLSIRDVLMQRTFGAIAEAMKPLAAENPGSLALESGDIPLSPAQRAFFEIGHPNPDAWQLVWCTSMDGPVDLERMHAAFERVVGSHPALRCRFERRPNGWRANVHADVSAHDVSLVPLESVEDHEVAERIDEHVQRLGSTIGLDSGSLVRLGVFPRGPDGPVHIVWAAHHLVADVVSLQILGQELLEAYGATLKPRHSDGRDRYIEWVGAACDRGKITFPAGPPRPSGRQVRVVHGNEIGAGLMRDSTARHRRAIAILVAGLMRASSQVLPARATAMCVENNGRMRLDLDMELPFAVGWLTTYQSFRVDGLAQRSSAELLELLHRQVTTAAGTQSFGDQPNLVLNYLGDLGSGRDADLSTRLLGAHDDFPGAGLLFEIEVVCWVAGAEFQSLCRYDPTHLDAEKIRQLQDRFAREITSLLVDSEDLEVEQSAGDFPDADLSQEDFERILKGVRGR